jgi:hypothetical protein
MPKMQGGFKNQLLPQSNWKKTENVSIVEAAVFCSMKFIYFCNEENHSCG